MQFRLSECACNIEALNANLYVLASITHQIEYVALAQFNLYRRFRLGYDLSSKF